MSKFPHLFKSHRVQFGEIVIFIIKRRFGVKYVWYMKFRFVSLRISWGWEAFFQPLAQSIDDSEQSLFHFVIVNGVLMGSVYALTMCYKLKTCPLINPDRVLIKSIIGWVIVCLSLKILEACIAEVIVNIEKSSWITICMFPSNPESFLKWFHS